MTAREQAQPLGTPTWIDITTDDVDGLRRFAQEALGWQAPPGDPAYGGYTTASVGEQGAGNQVCGIAPAMGTDRSPGELEQDYLTVYLATDDVDATLAQVETHGGTRTLGPMDVPGTGRMAVAKDPQGNSFGLWHANPCVGTDRVDEPGFPTWFELGTADPEAAATFYGEVFGVGFGAQDVSGMPYQLTEQFGIYGSEPSGWQCFLAVDGSLEQAMERVTGAGGVQTVAPTDFQYGRFCQFRTPGGAVLGFFQSPEPGPAA